MSGSSCYYPNGDLSTAGDIPCSSGNGVQCCPQGWTCQDNGLCYLQNEQYYGRYTCTDKSWQSSGCPHICTHGNTAAGDEAVLSCGDGFCCDANRPDANGDDSKGCCKTSTARFQLSNRQMVSRDSPASTSSSQTQPPTPTTPASSPISSSDSDSDDGDDDNGDDDDGPSHISTPSSTTISTHPSSTSSSTTISTHPFPTPSSSTVSTHPSSDVSSRTPASISPHPIAHTSVLVVTSVVSKPGRGSSTVVSSKTSIIAEPAATSAASTSSPTASKHNDIGKIVGPAVAVPLAVIALAGLLFFVWRRRKQRKDFYDSNNHAGYEPKDPVDMYAAHKTNVPKMPELESGDPQKTPSGTAPPSYRGVSGVANTLNIGSSNPTSPGLASSAARNSEPPGTTPVPPGGSPSMPQGPAGGTEPSELPGSTYHPYRPPGKPGP